MKLYFKKKLMTYDHNVLFIADADGKKHFGIKTTVMLGKTICVLDPSGKEVATLKQDLKSPLPKYNIYIGERRVMQIRKNFSPLMPKYTMIGLGWELGKNAAYHSYQICKNETPIVSMGKSKCSWGDTYEIDIAESQDVLTAVAAVLAIDMGIEGKTFMQDK